MTRRLIGQLDRLGQARPAALAVHQDRGEGGADRLNWAQLRAAVAAMALRLRATLPAGAVVLLAAPNQPAFHVGFLGALLADLSVFPVSPQLTSVELASAAQRSGAAAVVGVSGVSGIAGMSGIAQTDIPDIPAIPDTREIDAAFAAHAGTGALLLLNSGIPDRPRIVRRSAAALDAVAANCVEAIGATPDDVVLAVAPLHHSYGLEHGLLMPLLAGAAVDLIDLFDPVQVMAKMAHGWATILPGVPFLFEAITMIGRTRSAGPARRASLRRIYSAGGPLPRSVYEAFDRQFGLKIGQVFGSTEIGSVTFADPAAAGFDPASVGQAMAGVEIRILDRTHADPDAPLAPGEEGQIAVRAPSMFDGLLDGPCEMLCDGFFLTGDLGRLDAAGRLSVTGRIHALINVGGRKVNPREVERVLAEHPAVREAAVSPIAVTQTLSRLKAAVLLEPDADPAVDEAALREFVRERLSAYKVPRVFELRSSPPRPAWGQVLREAVRS